MKSKALSSGAFFIYYSAKRAGAKKGNPLRIKLCRSFNHSCAMSLNVWGIRDFLVSLVHSSIHIAYAYPVNNKEKTPRQFLRIIGGINLLDSCADC